MDTGICVSVFGAPAWFYLHLVAAGYPLDPDAYDLKHDHPLNYTRRNYVNFFKNVGKTLPCGLCRSSYDRFIDELRVEDYTDSRRSLAEFVFKIHNKVNEKLGVPLEPNFDSIYKKFESFHAACPKNEEAKGCTEPLGGFVKMKCRVSIEPFHKSTANIKYVVFVAFIVLLMMYYYR